MLNLQGHFLSKWILDPKSGFVNSSPPEENGRHSASDIFRCIFSKKSFLFWLKFHHPIFTKRVPIHKTMTLYWNRPLIESFIFFLTNQELIVIIALYTASNPRQSAGRSQSRHIRLLALSLLVLSTSPLLENWHHLSGSTAAKNRNNAKELHA